MNKIPNPKAEQLKKSLNKVLEFVQEIEAEYGDECVIDNKMANEINDILDSIGAFVINSLD